MLQRPPSPIVTTVLEQDNYNYMIKHAKPIYKVYAAHLIYCLVSGVAIGLIAYYFGQWDWILFR